MAAFEFLDPVRPETSVSVIFAYWFELGSSQQLPWFLPVNSVTGRFVCGNAELDDPEGILLGLVQRQKAGVWGCWLADCGNGPLRATEDSLPQCEGFRGLFPDTTHLPAPLHPTAVPRDTEGIVGSCRRGQLSDVQCLNGILCSQYMGPFCGRCSSLLFSVIRLEGSCLVR